MTLVAWNSFYFDARGWTMGNTSRTLGTGQNGIASIRATLGADAAATFGFAPLTELITGFCLQTTTIGSASFLRLYSSGSIVTSINMDTDGSIYILRNNSVEIGRSIPGILAGNVEAYIEVRELFSSSVGEVEIRVNGNPTPVLDIGPVNVGGSSANQIGLYSNASGGTRDHSAWYLIDPTTGSAPLNDFLGHIRYGILNPGGNGNASEFDGSDGNSTDNYLLVDDGSSPDDSSTYVSSSTLNERDTYAMGNMPTPSSLIYGVGTVIRARKSDAGTRAAAAVIRRSGTDYPGADSYLGLSFDNYRTFVDEDPSTSAAWTDAGVDAMELGPKVTV